MEKLSIIEQKILPVLNLIEYCCDKAELDGKKNQSELKIMYSDLEESSFLKENVDLYLAKKYLQKNGIVFSITIDIYEDDVNDYIDNEHPGEAWVQIFIIKDKDIKTIKEKIVNLKNKLYFLEKEPPNKEQVLMNNKKRITLPKFARTEWSKVSIKFIDEVSALLSDSKETKPIIPESIGCLDERTEKADRNWKFLLSVAKGQGVTKPIIKGEREKQKKQKQKITDILRKIFQNDTDPFETEKGGIYRAKFIIRFVDENSFPTGIKKEFLDLNEAYKEMTKE
jgi:hypothetical protein